MDNFVRIMLVAVLALIFIHDIAPLDFDTHGSNDAEPVSAERHDSDHSDGCGDACPCVIHVLEKSSNNGLAEATIFHPCSINYIAPEHKHESIVPKTIDRPPKA